jgi:hypothetical protein
MDVKSFITLSPAALFISLCFLGLVVDLMTFYSFHNFLQMPAEARFEPSNLSSIVDGTTSCASASGKRMGWLYALLNCTSEHFQRKKKS